MRLRTRRKITALASLATVVSLGLTACGSGSTTYKPGNMALNAVANPSDHKGGTLRMDHPSDFDSIDPGNTYYAHAWNFLRLIHRSLLTFTPAPGAANLQLTGDLATGLGTTDDGGKTWTYHIRTGVKFEDGTVITSKDIKYAVERTWDVDTLGNGPTYFQQLMDPNNTYPGAFKDPSPDKLGFQGITTPDDSTIVFHLVQPFADFNYLATIPQTAPVERAKDTGKDYVKHPIASGPYMVQNYDPGVVLNLVRNPYWDQSNDPIRKALPDKIVVNLKHDANDIDNQLLSDAVDLDVNGTGVQAAAQTKILKSKTYAANADDALSGALAYANINTKVAPFDNVHCRRAVEYAIDKTAMQTAFGGPYGADIATDVWPTVFADRQGINPYPSGSNNQGNKSAAENELKLCGKPNGFSTTITARSNRPKEMAAAQALQKSLAKIGVKTDIQSFTASTYFSQFAGVPQWVHDHNAGLLIMQWAPDFPEEYGFFQQIVDGRAIKTNGNSNLSEEANPAIEQMIDQAANTTDPAARTAIWAKMDQTVMDDAVIAPFVWTKSLLYRPPSLTNVSVSPAYSGEYDYVNLGVQ